MTQSKFFCSQIGTKGGFTISRTPEEAAAMSVKNPREEGGGEGVRGSYEKWLKERRGGKEGFKLGERRRKRW